MSRDEETAWAWLKGFLMGLLAAVLGLLLSAVVASAQGRPGAAWTATDRVLYGASVGLMLADWAQTRTMAASGWPDGRYEANPILGRYPTPAKVDAYTAVALLGYSYLVIEAAGRRRHQRRWLMGALLVLEAYAVTYNHAAGVRIDFGAW